MSDPLGDMLRTAHADERASFRALIERERRLQDRAKRIRSACRRVILIAGLSGIGLIVLGGQLNHEVVGGLGCMLLLPTIVATIILLFMGGFAPLGVRTGMEKRDRDHLDR
jgi:hypothetical protein